MQMVKSPFSPKDNFGYDINEIMNIQRCSNDPIYSYSNKGRRIPYKVVHRIRICSLRVLFVLILYHSKKELYCLLQSVYPAFFLFKIISCKL